MVVGDKKNMKLIIFIILFSITFWFYAPRFVKANDNWTPEFKEFCQKYMPYVNQYPASLSAGCCNIDHKSNDVLKEGWEGESLLICDGKEIV